MPKDVKPKILLVEDSDIGIMVAKLNFAALGCDIDIANTSRDALDLAHNKYDIIFMDIGLDEMDGYEVTKKIRASISENKNTPIIALTAHSNEQVKDLCHAAGMNDFLQKPLTQENLKTILDKWIPN